MNKQIRNCVLSLLLLSGAALGGTLPLVDSAFVRSGSQADTQQAWSGALALKNAGGDFCRIAMMKADVSAATGTVSSATFSVYAKDTMPHTLYVYGVNDSAGFQNWTGGTNGTATWNSVSTNGLFQPLENLYQTGHSNLVLLGSQMLPGVNTGDVQVAVSGSPLVNLLNTDTDGLQTFVFCVDTNANGMAVRPHNHANAPSLEITTTNTLEGFVHTTSWGALSNAEMLALLEEWYALASVGDADEPPTTRETEIYELFMRDSGKPIPPNIGNYGDMGPWGSAGEIQEVMPRLDALKDLGYLEAAIYHADMILTTRTNMVVETTGQMEHTWVSFEEDAWCNPVQHMPYLSSGRNCGAIASVAKWILQHPDIWDETAPVDPAIPLSGFGTTYRDRAEFYLQELLKVYDAWERENFWWEFDPVNHCATWIQNVATYSNMFNQYKADYPDGFDVADIYDIIPYAFGTKPERQFFKAYNRQWFMNKGYLVTADALMLLDPVQYADFNVRAVEVSTKFLNTWRHLRQEYVDPEPIGTTYVWQYKPLDDPLVKAEDGTHLFMSMQALESHRERGLFTQEELENLAATLPHRLYDFDNFLPYSNMDRRYFLDANGNPYDPGGTHANSDSDGPRYGDWVGEYGSDAELQLFAAKCLEVTAERIRLLNEDINAFSLSDDNTLTTMGMLFQLHEAKIARQRLNLPNDPSNAAPVIAPLSPAAVLDGATTNEPVTGVSATDTDVGQTVSYWIVGGNDEYKFKMDSATGAIELRDTIHRTTQSVYTLLIEVADNGAPFNSATSSVDVVVYDPAADTDGDGLFNDVEVALGTDPADAASLFAITGKTVFPTLGKIRVTWPTRAGVFYKVWKSPDLTHWTVARDWAPAGTPPTDLLELDLTPSNGFFKIEADIQ